MGGRLGHEAEFDGERPMSIQSTKADELFFALDRYRSGPSSRQEHAPEGAQERQCLPEALGEALPLPGS